ncbi:ATP synthase subunit b [Maioricimonas rarisocia]|uniref:ATP synthase subunit b n=1 Tax=Maioricimonas rarisocia TaxID=2528026 RepID=A0A517Z1B5_9PLAN|nr:F0F1 ATP synthase subunit B [Maioricimonas rarisocia]QDU36272.1 ATP synthase subunit b [Maioricimonas rarisocia]
MRLAIRPEILFLTVACAWLGLVQSGFAADEGAASAEADHVLPEADEILDHDADGHGHEAAHGEGGGAHHDEPHDVDGDGVVDDLNQPPLSIKLPRLAFALIVFVSFVLLMKKFAWQPLIEGFNEREGRVNRAYAAAEEARLQAASLRDEHDAKVQAVQDEVREIVTAARREAEAEKQRIVAEAEAEAAKLRAEALADIEQARQQAMASLDARVDEYVGMATEHVAGRRVTLN